jgi:hypothetical protein
MSNILIEIVGSDATPTADPGRFAQRSPYVKDGRSINHQQGEVA